MGWGNAQWLPIDRNNRMRVSCLNCARKHLANACVLIHEARFGYPDHMWLAIGHLCQAEVELAEAFPLLATAVHQHRKAYEESAGEYSVPIMKLIGECSGEAQKMSGGGV